MWEDGDGGGGQNRWLVSLCEMGGEVLASNTVAAAIRPEPDPVLVEILQTLKQQKALVESTLKQHQAKIADLAQRCLGWLVLGSPELGFEWNRPGLMLRVSLYVLNVG